MSSRYAWGVVVIYLCDAIRGVSSVNPLVGANRQNVVESMRDPDATGEYQIPDPSGFDISEPWPGMPMLGWKLSVEVKADVPVPDGFTTVTRISYIPPESLPVTSNDTGNFAPMDDSWYPCTNLWVTDTLKASSGVRVDPTCSSLLEDECIADMREPLSESFVGGWDSEWPGIRSGPTTIPDSCGSDLGGDDRELLSFEPLSQSLTHFNLDTIYYAKDDDVHREGNARYFDEAVSRVWVVGTAWGYSNNSEYRTESLDVNATITCVHANNKATNNGDSDSGSDSDSDSDLGSDPDPDSAVRLRTFSWALMAFIMALGFAVC